MSKIKAKFICTTLLATVVLTTGCQTGVHKPLPPGHTPAPQATQSVPSMPTITPEPSVAPSPTPEEVVVQPLAVSDMRITDGQYTLKLYDIMPELPQTLYKELNEPNSIYRKDIDYNYTYYIKEYATMDIILSNENYSRLGNAANASLVTTIIVKDNTWKTLRDVRIGSTKAELEKAYGKGVEETLDGNAMVTYWLSEMYIAFTIKDDTVSRICLGTTPITKDFVRNPLPNDMGYVYTNQSLGFEIKLPSNWATKIHISQEGGMVKFYYVDKGSQLPVILIIEKTTKEQMWLSTEYQEKDIIMQTDDYVFVQKPLTDVPYLYGPASMKDEIAGLRSLCTSILNTFSSISPTITHDATLVPKHIVGTWKIDKLIARFNPSNITQDYIGRIFECAESSYTNEFNRQREDTIYIGTWLTTKQLVNALHWTQLTDYYAGGKIPKEGYKIEIKCVNDIIDTIFLINNDYYILRDGAIYQISRVTP